jgi:hypothetical protein
MLVSFVKEITLVLSTFSCVRPTMHQARMSLCPIKIQTNIQYTLWPGYFHIINEKNTNEKVTTLQKSLIKTYTSWQETRHYFKRRCHSFTITNMGHTVGWITMEPAYVNSRDPKSVKFMKKRGMWNKFNDTRKVKINDKNLTLRTHQ